MRKFEIDYLYGTVMQSDYEGAFPQSVHDVIKGVIGGKVVSLYSGSSLLGDVRVDIEHKNATVNCDVEEFVKDDVRDWDFVILDPPYQITRTDAKLNSYGIKGAVSANVDRRRLLKRYFQEHADNVLWLDQCAPIFTGFCRVKLWLVLTGSYKNVRVLSWLKREMKPLL